VWRDKQNNTLIRDTPDPIKTNPIFPECKSVHRPPETILKFMTFTRGGGSNSSLPLSPPSFPETWRSPPPPPSARHCVQISLILYSVSPESFFLSPREKRRFSPLVNLTSWFPWAKGGGGGLGFRGQTKKEGLPAGFEPSLRSLNKTWEKSSVLLWNIYFFDFSRFGPTVFRFALFPPE
jgi:hypothetical protein